MSRVRCRQSRCGNWDQGRCTALEILLDSEGICLTQDEEDVGMDEFVVKVADWDEEEFEEEPWEDEEEWPEDEEEDGEEDADDDWTSDPWKR
mgnify:CR=1 FL=1